MAHGLNAAPVGQGERFASIDVLRGVALLGILAMNVMTFAMPMAAYSNPTVFTDHSGSNRVTYWIVHTVFDMKMMGLFSMLFGAGVVVWSRKAERPEDARRLRWLWLRRMWWLLVIGMVHAWLIWEGDILVSYAVCGLAVLWWLRRLPARWLLVAAGGFFLVHLLLSGAMAYNTWFLFSASDAAAGQREQALEVGRLTAEQLAEQQEGMRGFLSPTEAETAEELDRLLGSWTEVFRGRAAFSFMMQAMFLPLFVFWRSSAMMLLGAALTKMGVLTGEQPARVYARLAAVGYGVGVPMVVGGLAFNDAHGFEVASYAFPGQWFNLVGAVPVMLGHTGLVLWLVKSGRLSSLTPALARVGQMAFTNYLMQSVLCSLIFYGWGLGMAGEFGRLGQELVVLGIWAVEILWSEAWLSRYRFGPAEWLWRSLTYWTLQPMRRTEPTG
jgi:uncharacterized protein